MNDHVAAQTAGPPDNDPLRVGKTVHCSTGTAFNADLLWAALANEALSVPLRQRGGCTSVKPVVLTTTPGTSDVSTVVATLPTFANHSTVRTSCCCRNVVDPKAGAAASPERGGSGRSRHCVLGETAAASHHTAVAVAGAGAAPALATHPTVLDSVR